MDKGISAVVLAYGEAENLRVLLPSIREQLESLQEPFEIIVVDAAIPMDDTSEVCQGIASYVNQEEPFFGGALRTGIRHAAKDKFLILDGDCSHDPRAIPRIYEQFLKGADIVIGSRYIKGGVSNDSKPSLLMSNILNGVFRFALKVPTRDISTDYRMYHTQALKDIELSCERYDILQEVILKIKILNGGAITIDEVPIEFNKRAFGQSKRELFIFIMHYLRTVLKLISLRLLYERRPERGADEKNALLLTNIGLYAIIGCCGAVVDFLFFLISNVFISVPEISNVIGALFGFFFTFYFNTFFNFISRGHYLAKFLTYGSICLVGAFISSGMMWLLMDYINLYLLKWLCIAVAAIIQFILNKNITYRFFGNEGPRNPNLR